MISSSTSRWCFFLLMLTLGNINFLLADFGPPIDVSVPSTGNASVVSIATNASGDTIAVWTEASGADVIVRSAFLPANGSWSAPVDVTTTGIASNPKVLIDDNGNGFACWQVGSNVQAAYTPFNGPWQQYTTQAGSQPNIAINPTTGDAVLIYIFQNGSQYTTRSNLFTIASGWQGTVNVSSTSTSVLASPAVAVSTSGQVFAAWKSNILGNNIIFAFGSISGVNLSWGSSFLTLGNNTIGSPSVFIDSNTGYGTIVSRDSFNEIVATTIFNNGSGTGSTILSSPASSISDAATSNDSQGNGIAVWVQDGTVQFAKYDGSNQTWSGPATIPSSGVPVGAPDVTFDSQGNAWATWATASGAIETAFLPAGSSTWQNLQVVIPSGGSLPAIGAANGANAALVWIAPNGSFIVVQSALSGFTPPPTPPSTQPSPPSSFFGKVVKVKFLEQTEYVHHLGWGLSLDSTVIGYLIYRNGQPIAILPLTQLSYEDHNRPKNQRDIYLITSFNAQGVESVPLSIVVP